MKITIEALTEKQLENIHEATLELLERYGVIIEHKEAQEIFRKNGAKVEGNIVKINRDLVLKAIKSAPSSFKLSGRDDNKSVWIGEGHDTVFGPSAGVVYVSDAKRGRQSAKLQDLRNFLKLTQTSDYCNISTAGLLYPSDIEPNSGLFLQMMEAIKLSDKPLLGLTQDEKISEYTINMAKIATEGNYTHYVMGIVNSLSPLAWDEKMAGSIMTFAKYNQPLIIACCSMAGFTSPTKIGETVVSNNAEILAGITLSQLVREGAPVIYGNTSAVADMLTMGLAIGAPEYALISTAASMLSKMYKIPYRSGGGLTDSKDLDMQAGVESATNLLIAMSNKVNVMFHSLGILESFLCIGYEKWIIDEDTISRIKRIQRGIDDISIDTVDIIGKVGAEGNYLQHPTTMDNFKREFLRPKVTDRQNYDTWKDKGENQRDLAYKLWNKRINEYKEPYLSKEVLIKLEKYIQNK